SAQCTLQFMNPVFLLGGFFLLCALSARADTVIATVAAGTTPFAVAINPVTNKIYVVNAGSNNVTVIDGATNATTTVAVGLNPFYLAVNPVTNKIYVSHNLSNSVTVIDGVTNITRTVAVGTQPTRVAVNIVTDKAYVANVGNCAFLSSGV